MLNEERNDILSAATTPPSSPHDNLSSSRCCGGEKLTKLSRFIKLLNLWLSLSLSPACSMSKKDSEDVPQTPSTDTVPEGSFNEVDGTAENLTKLSEAEHGQEATTPLIQTTLVSHTHT